MTRYLRDSLWWLKNKPALCVSNSETNETISTTKNGILNPIQSGCSSWDCRFEPSYQNEKKSERATAAHFASPQSWNSTLHAEIFCTVWMRKDGSLHRFTFWWAISQPYLLVIRRSEYQVQCEQQKLNGCPLDGSAFLAEKIECEDAKRIASPPPCILRLWSKSCAWFNLPSRIS